MKFSKPLLSHCFFNASKNNKINRVTTYIWRSFSSVEKTLSLVEGYLNCDSSFLASTEVLDSRTLMTIKIPIGRGYVE